MHICSALLKFISHQHESLKISICLFYIYVSSNATSYFIYAYTYTSIYISNSNPPTVTRLVFPPIIKRVKLEYLVYSNVLHLLPLKTPHHLNITSLFTFANLFIFKIFATFLSRILSDIALMAWDDTPSTGAGCRPREGSLLICSHLHTGQERYRLAFTIKVYCWSAMRESSIPCLSLSTFLPRDCVLILVPPIWGAIGAPRHLSSR